MDFIPPFCPNRHCPTHTSWSTLGRSWFIRKGSRATKVVGRVPRFQCGVCRNGFSSRTFDIDYWTHRSMNYSTVLSLLVGGSGLRQASRTLEVSTRLLANRHLRLSRQALVLHSNCMEEFCLRESLVFDGFESFAFSQYYPNNLNLLVTSESQFLVGLNASVLRRKGRMTVKQKLRREQLEEKYKAPSNAIYRSSRELLTLGCHLSFGSGQLPITIHSDQKREYATILSRVEPYCQWRDHGLLIHNTISSRADRTLNNPLFPVNYLDRQIRKDLAEHVRESVRFARRIQHSLERAVIYLAHHNYFKAFRNRSLDHEVTHAQMVGMERTSVESSKREFFTQRAMDWRVSLEAWQQAIWRRATQVPVHTVTPLARHLHSA